MTVIVDGRAISARVLAQVKSHIARLPNPPRLTVFTCAPNFETQKFLALKKRCAEEIGVQMKVIEFSPTLALSEMQQSILLAQAETEGIIVQLPFPAHIPKTELLATIAPTHDIDVFYYRGEKTKCLPPVIGAIDEISTVHGVEWVGKRVVVLGRGLLVGAPAALYATARGSDVVIVDKTASDIANVTRTADILITGAGAFHFITPSMIKDGVVIFDAGTSEDNGVLVGDVHPDVAKKSSLFTPVPGGIGPITVAVLLRNLINGEQSPT